MSTSIQKGPEVPPIICHYGSCRDKRAIANGMYICMRIFMLYHSIYTYYMMHDHYQYQTLAHNVCAYYCRYTIWTLSRALPNHTDIHRRNDGDNNNSSNNNCAFSNLQIKMGKIFRIYIYIHRYGKALKIIFCLRELCILTGELGR